MTSADDPYAPLASVYDEWHQRLGAEWVLRLEMHLARYGHRDRVVRCIGAATARPSYGSPVDSTALGHRGGRGSGSSRLGGERGRWLPRYQLSLTVPTRTGASPPHPSSNGSSSARSAGTSVCLPAALILLAPFLGIFPDDRHVLAAAIRAGAQAIVTFNLADFPADRLASYNIEAKHPDDFVIDTIDLSPGAVAKVIADQAGALKNPPRSIPELLDTLRDQGLVRSVG